MIDIVWPKNNEEEFIEMAERLGHTGICFVYSTEDFRKKKLIKSKINIKYGILSDHKNIKKAKKLTDIILVESCDQNRDLIEKNKNIIVFGLERENRADFIHQRRSGLNHIICKIAVKNSVGIAYSFNSILNEKTKMRNYIIGRMGFNIKLCRKYKTKMIIGSFAKDPYDMRSFNDLSCFFKIIGMHASETKTSL